MKNFLKYILESNGTAANEDIAPLDETEALNILIDDEVLKNAQIAAYNVGQTTLSPNGSKEIPVTPKKFPTKAVDVVFPVQQLLVEVFFDPNQKQWDSDIDLGTQHVKLSPDQMGAFFQTSFYQQLLDKLQKSWPLTDKFYSELYEGLCAKEMKVFEEPRIDEVATDKEMGNKDVTGDGIRDYTPSGRKIVNFSDNGVSAKGAMFFCWPNEKNVYRWSSWKDWKKIKPLCRMRFYFNDIPYGMSLSTLGDDKSYKNRGFRGYSLDPNLPPVQWLTHEENESLIKLAIVEKFIKHCIAKIERHLSESPEEIYKKINNPEKITVNEIAKTQACIRRTLNEVIKERQIDNFKWS